MADVVRVEDHGAQRARELAKEDRRLELYVGVPPDVAANPHPKRKGRTIGQVAVWNEYGTGTKKPPYTPARSFVFAYLEGRRDVINAQLASATHRVIFEGAEERKVLSKLGGEYIRGMKARIVRIIEPENTDATLQQKQGSTPLIDTRTMFEAMGYKVV